MLQPSTHTPLTITGLVPLLTGDKHNTHYHVFEPTLTLPRQLGGGGRGGRKAVLTSLTPLTQALSKLT